MYQTLSESDFRDAFVRMDRKDNFSYEGLGALYDYLEDIESGEYELDVIALCCDYAEDTIENVLKEHDLKTIEELEEATSVVWQDGESVLYQQF